MLQLGGGMVGMWYNCALACTVRYTYGSGGCGMCGGHMMYDVPQKHEYAVDTASLSAFRYFFLKNETLTFHVAISI